MLPAPTPPAGSPPSCPLYTHSVARCCPPRVYLLTALRVPHIKQVTARFGISLPHIDCTASAGPHTMLMPTTQWQQNPGTRATPPQSAQWQQHVMISHPSQPLTRAHGATRHAPRWAMALQRWRKIRQLHEAGYCFNTCRTEVLVIDSSWASPVDDRPPPSHPRPLMACTHTVHLATQNTYSPLACSLSCHPPSLPPPTT